MNVGRSDLVCRPVSRGMSKGRHTRACACVYILACMYVCIYIYIYMYKCIYIYIYIDICAGSWYEARAHSTARRSPEAPCPKVYRLHGTLRKRLAWSASGSSIWKRGPAPKSFESLKRVSRSEEAIAPGLEPIALTFCDLNP